MRIGPASHTPHHTTEITWMEANIFRREDRPERESARPHDFTDSISLLEGTDLRANVRCAMELSISDRHPKEGSSQSASMSQGECVGSSKTCDHHW